MGRIRIAPIVEGHGEVEAVRVLLSRLCLELLGTEHYPDILTPIRQPRSQLIRRDGLAKALRLAGLKLQSAPDATPAALVLLLLDADRDLPCTLGPRLLATAGEAASYLDVACVVANPEYETWFVAAAPSLGRFLDLPAEVPEDPEAEGLKKAWIQRFFRRPKYSETIDQPAMTAAMDLALCRQRSPSFAKLCRELEQRLS